MKRFLLLLIVVFAFSCSKDDDSASKSLRLKTSVTPSESGSVSPASGNFGQGEVVTLTAVPETGFIFKQWSGGVSGTGNPVTVTMDSDKTITAVFEAGELEVTGDIIGKWTINNSTTAQASGESVKQGNLEECYLFSLVFNSDGTFIISHRGGEVNGDYFITSPNTISLGGAGNLIISNITSNSITFEIELFGICSWEGRAILDNTHEEGSCVSFLNCNDGTVWKDGTNNSVEFVRFTNSLSNIWYENLLYNLDENCRSSVLTNQNTEEPTLLMRNNPSELIFLQQLNSGGSYGKLLV